MHGKTQAIRNCAAAALHRGRSGAQSPDQARAAREAAEAGVTPTQRRSTGHSATPFARISAALADAAAARLQPGRRLRFGREWL